ncbi:MAG: hypothetical protein EBZ49_15285, partial [Proteobacteria bacterium]|nr:hypothetical protein [Pseudomonadota bacterium]
MRRPTGAKIIAGFRAAVKRKIAGAYVFIFASAAFFSCVALKNPYTGHIKRGWASRDKSEKYHGCYHQDCRKEIQRS